MAERRNAYRIQWSVDDAPVSVAMHIRRVGSFPAKLLDLSIRGAGVQFGDEAPDAAVGDRVHLVFGMNVLDKPFMAKAFVRSRLEVDSGRRYGLVFQEPEKIEAALPDALGPLFNRRAAVRVEPKQKIEVDLEAFVEPTGWAATTSSVADLSVSGMAVHVDADFERALKKQDRLRLAFELGRTEFNFGARIVNRRLAKGTVRWGMQFERERSARFEEQQAAIESFVKQH